MRCKIYALMYIYTEFQVIMKIFVLIPTQIIFFKSLFYVQKFSICLPICLYMSCNTVHTKCKIVLLRCL